MRAAGEPHHHTQVGGFGTFRLEAVFRLEDLHWLHNLGGLNAQLLRYTISEISFRVSQWMADVWLRAKCDVVDCFDFIILDVRNTIDYATIFYVHSVAKIG